MKTTLNTQLPVHRVAIFAEMAWMERRPELGLLCRTAQEVGERITPELVRRVLPGLSEPGARNVAAWCRTLGLCDEEGQLAGLGVDAAARDEAPVPEQGVYDFWLAEHPVIGARSLAVERLSAGSDRGVEAPRSLPVTPELGRVFTSVANRDARYVVRSLPTKSGEVGGVLRQTQATCELNWTLDFTEGVDRWELRGQIEVPDERGGDKVRPMQHEPESVGLDLWKLAERWGRGPLEAHGKWSVEERCLAVPFAGLAEDEVDHLECDVALDEVEVGAFGSFRDVLLRGVPIGPVSKPEAQAWALARLDHTLSRDGGYLTRSEVRARFIDRTTGTRLERWCPVLPDHEALIERVGDDPERFWGLAAPVDLAPSEVARGDLTALVLGGEAAQPEQVPDGQLRLSRASAWSMGELVERLLHGGAPLRVLLCDRYVRGDHLEALELFVAALRQVAPDASLDIWTDKSGCNFRFIEGLTGRVPRTYAEAFGKAALHDRYLLVLPTRGEPYGWHMTNSPLDARRDGRTVEVNSPLRWRDLAALRVPAEQLEPALRGWFDGGTP